MLVTMQLATGAPLRPTWEADAWTLSVDVDAVKVDIIKDGDNDVLDISVALPDGDEPRPGTIG